MFIIFAMRAKPYTRQALRHEVSGLRKQTLLQTTSIVERRTVLLKRVQRFREIQRFYMPGFDPRNNTNTEHDDSTDSNISPSRTQSCICLQSSVHRIDANS